MWLNMGLADLAVCEAPDPRIARVRVALQNLAVAHLLQVCDLFALRYQIHDHNRPGGLVDELVGEDLLQGVGGRAAGERAGYAIPYLLPLCRGKRHSSVLLES